MSANGDATGGPEPTILWHYTNLAGLIGIVERRKLWATDLRYLNDSTELAYGLDRVLSVLRTDGLRQRDTREHDFLLTIADLPEGVVTKEMIRAYVACFSTHHDALILWRGYGHQGYALGFYRSAVEARFGVTLLADPSLPHLSVPIAGRGSSPGRSALASRGLRHLADCRGRGERPIGVGPNRRGFEAWTASGISRPPPCLIDCDLPRLDAMGSEADLWHMRRQALLLRVQ